MINTETLKWGAQTIEAPETKKTFFDQAMEGFSQFFPITEVSDGPSEFLQGVQQGLERRHGVFPEALVREYFFTVNNESRRRTRSFDVVSALEKRRGVELIQRVTSISDMQAVESKTITPGKAGELVVYQLHQMQDNPNY